MASLFLPQPLAASHDDLPTDMENARLLVRLGKIVENYHTYQHIASKSCVAAVVKADAYGLGLARVALALAQDGCDSFFVARLEEAITLRKLLGCVRIFVLDGVSEQSVPALLQYRLTPVLNSLCELERWSKAGLAGNGQLEAALHVDTGMNRLGLTQAELALLSAEAVKRFAGVNLILVMSHLACADDEGKDAPMNRLQLSKFKAALAMLPCAPASLSASSGTFLGRDYHFDLIRQGVALYGANPKRDLANPMQTVAVVNAKILQCRRIDKDESVGYAATFRAERPTMIATVALGYADGIPRSTSNKGQAAIGGVRVPIVGRVSMDLVTLDVTDLSPLPQAGQDVELLGDTITLEQAAKWAGTNAYEILTRLRRMPRHYLE